MQEQAGGPIEAPGERAFTHEPAVAMLEAIPGYLLESGRVFGTQEIDISKVTETIAEFEKTLVITHSPFDLRILEDPEALKSRELAGCRPFKKSGCVVCHNGPALGGRSFQ